MISKEVLEARFLEVSPDVSVQFALVFRGENALTAASALKWPATLCHSAPNRRLGDRDLPPTFRTYLSADVWKCDAGAAIRFDLRKIGVRLRELNPIEDFAELTVRRMRGRVACARHGEPGLWGFGRPSTMPGHKPNSEFATVRDYRPERHLEWHFRPLFVVIRPSRGANGRPYALKFSTRWIHGAVLITAERDPSDAPAGIQRYVRGGQTAVRQEPAFNG